MTLLGEGGQFDHNIVEAIRIIRFCRKLLNSNILTVHQLWQPKITKFCPFTPQLCPHKGSLGMNWGKPYLWAKFAKIFRCQVSMAYQSSKYLVENNLYSQKGHLRILLCIEFVWSNWPPSPNNVLMSQITSTVDQFRRQNFFSAWFFKKRENKLKSDFTWLTPCYVVTKSGIMGNQALALRKW